jgi:hypothetical protein
MAMGLVTAKVMDSVMVMGSATGSVTAMGSVTDLAMGLVTDLAMGSAMALELVFLLVRLPGTKYRWL